MEKTICMQGWARSWKLSGKATCQDLDPFKVSLEFHSMGLAKDLAGRQN